MRIRRLRVLGVALVLSLIAVGISLVLFLLPRNVLANANSVGDFVAVNDGKFWVDDHPWLANLFHFPDRDTENEHLRLVAIDEPSLNPPTDPKNPGLGQFPWDRRVYGVLLRRLHAAGAKVVTFDAAFFEPTHDPAQDAAFAAGMRVQPSVLALALGVTTGGILVEAEKPPPVLAAAAAQLGSTTVDNPGGWLVGQPLVVTATSPTGAHTDYPSLAGATVERYSGDRIVPIDAWHARFGGVTVPLDGEGELLMLPFKTHEFVDIGNSGAGGPTTRAGSVDETAAFFQSISFVDLLKMDLATLKAFAGGDVIVVGATAQALGDYIVTPNGRYPGVFSNLRLMDQLMRHYYITRVPPWIDIALIVALPLLVGFAVTQLRATVGVAVALGIVVLYSLFAIWLFGATLHWIDLIHVDLGIVLAALFVALYRTITEGADKRVIREMFGKHVSPALVDQMLSHDDPLKALDLSGKRVKVTIFYSDIRGFTAMSEKMTPEQIYGQLNEYFEEMCRIVFQYGGYVDKFIGDCLMAVFSAPNPGPDDAYNAVRNAWDQQQRILEMMTEWAAQGRQVFTVGMGLNTGEVVMGNLGSSDRLNYTVIGDNVNTAARLYNVAKGGQTIISESTYEEVKDRFIVNELTPVFVKGKVLPLRNFEVLGLLEPGQPNTSTLLDPNNLPEAAVAADH
ncbi:MAG TPA: adenylate/guanylate cyclase domain-containing protein [Candidatus Sulfotelmatobacter sp.]|nr:adenylate/guanylate cyclase domain-containing protein [Candidatus Sulfotelmatobacter sp.]